MKISRFLILFMCVVHGHFSTAQKIIRYYDSSWNSVTKDSTYYECDFAPYQDLYICTCYWSDSKGLRSISVKDDTSLFSNTYGLSLQYYPNHRLKDSTYYYPDGKQQVSYGYFENGQLEDSVFYNRNRKIDSAFHYFQDGKVRAIYRYDSIMKKEHLLAFNEKGEELRDIVYAKEASFPGGDENWRKFLQKNLDPAVPVKNGAPEGTYQVVIRFIVKTDGSISRIVAETSHGYGMEDEVIRLLSKSPNWQPAVFLGETSEAYRRQPITFMVQSQ